MDNEELAKKIVEDRLHLNKLKNENKDLIESESNQIKTKINDSLLKTTKDWFIYKNIDLDNVKKVINSIEFNLSDKSEINTNVINKTHGLNGKRDTFVICDYKLTFDDRYQYEDKIEIAIGGLVFQSKFKKLF